MCTCACSACYIAAPQPVHAWSVCVCVCVCVVQLQAQQVEETSGSAQQKEVIRATLAKQEQAAKYDPCLLRPRNAYMYLCVDAC